METLILSGIFLWYIFSQIVEASKKAEQEKRDKYKKLMQDFEIKYGQPNKD